MAFADCTAVMRNLMPFAAASEKVWALVTVREGDPGAPRKRGGANFGVTCAEIYHVRHRKY